MKIPRNPLTGVIWWTYVSAVTCCAALCFYVALVASRGSDGIDMALFFPLGAAFAWIASLMIRAWCADE